MNRNTNAHFSELPNVEIARSTFDRSHSIKFSGNVSEVIPFFYDDILPGDTVSMDSSKLIRFQTMLTPFMDNMYCDIYWFFVPNRIVWDHWINFMGENTESAWLPSTEYSVPLLYVPPQAGEGDTPNNNKVGTILDYLGYPVELVKEDPDYDPEDPDHNKQFVPAQEDVVGINALPIRGYCKIMNDFFRDENLTDPINIYTGDEDVTATSEDSYIDDLPHGGKPFRAAKFADYFTSCLPFAQKGDPVNLNIAFPDYIPVTTQNERIPTPPATALTWHPYPATTGHHFTTTRSGSTTPGQVQGLYTTDTNGFVSDSAVPGVENTWYSAPSNLWAKTSYLTASFTVNDLRYAFQLQKLLERDARGGTRYIEVLKSHFNVDSPDQRLQRPEYLGGNRFPIVVNQVSNTAQSESDFLGDLGANSVTTDVHSDFTKSFTEHGMLFGLMVVRYDHTYSQGLEKFWMRRSRFDYYWPVFANIGEQPVDKNEIFLTGNTQNDDGTPYTFGFQECWADYRYKPNRLAGELRPYVSNSLGSWHLGDDYKSSPSLSDAWIREDPSNVDRVLAVTSSSSNQFWADFYLSFRHTRPMPVYSIPGLIDHN